MKRSILFLGFMVLIFGISFWGKQLLLKKGSDQVPPPASSPQNIPFKRIISLAPSITEILYALDLAENIVGVTRYCDFPEVALQKPKVGGYYDPNYEIMLTLQPDLVIMLEEHRDPQKFLAQAGIQFLVTNHQHVQEILNSILLIGRTCGVGDKAEKMVADMKQELSEIEQKMDQVDRPRVMITIGRNMGSAVIDDIYISAQGSFYDELLQLAGGQNAYQDGTVLFPKVTREGILRMNPDIIVDMITDLESSGYDEQTILQQWSNLSQVQAVKTGQVHIFGESYVVIPGPRFVSIVRDLAHTSPSSIMARVMTPPIIELKSYSYRIGPKLILSELNLTVARHDYVTIIGPNGAGKSTLLKCLMRIYGPGEGTILLHGKPLRDYSQRELARKISYVPQVDGHYAPFTVREFILMARYPYLSPFSALSPQDRQAVEHALCLTKMEQYAQRKIGTLSGGERQKILIAAAIAQETELMLLDEPTTFLDPKHQTEIITTLHTLYQEQQKTIIAVTHDITSAVLTSKKILALKEGTLMFYGPTNEITVDKHLQQLYDTPFYRTTHPTSDKPLFFPKGLAGLE